MNRNKEVIWCNCGAHMLSIENETWGSGKKVSHETYINLWNIKGMEHDSFRERIRHAWAALHGNLYYDGVCLNPQEVKRLIKALQRPYPKEEE